MIKMRKGYREPALLGTETTRTGEGGASSVEKTVLYGAVNQLTGAPGV